jgi:SAM-dependent methyltransferase
MSPHSHSLSLSDWHQRYLQQTTWTQNIREYLFARANLHQDDQVLEVGSGTGALLSQVAQSYPNPLWGVDTNRPALEFSRQKFQAPQLVQADGLRLPFPTGSFALTLCHYLLLWLETPDAMLSEMRRVTRPGGAVIALAEPDYLSRIDSPPPLDRLGRFQTESLKAQGVNVAIGRNLGNLFHQCGFQNIETGVLGAQWSAKHTSNPDDTEWMTIRADLLGKLPEDEIILYQEIDRAARQAGTRVLFIPTFFAIGFVA